MRRLDEDRQPEPHHALDQILASGAGERLLAHVDVADLRRGDRRHQILEQDLVEAHRRRCDAGADVGDVEHLEQPLHGAVLAEAAMQYGKRNVGVEQSAAGNERERLAFAVRAPAAVAFDLYPHDLVAGGQQTVAHGRAR